MVAMGEPECFIVKHLILAIPIPDGNAHHPGLALLTIRDSLLALGYMRSQLYFSWSSIDLLCPVSFNPRYCIPYGDSPRLSPLPLSDS